MVRLGSLTLVGGLPRDGVSILVVLAPHNLNMSDMSNEKSLNNIVKEAGLKGKVFSPDRCPVCKQCGLCHHSAIGSG